MKTPSALVLVLFAFVATASFAAAPAPICGGPAEAALELSLSELAPAAPSTPAGIAEPAPLPRLDPCTEHCLDIREECDANCTNTQCHRECRDSAFQCVRNC